MLELITRMAIGGDATRAPPGVLSIENHEGKMYRVVRKSVIEFAARGRASMPAADLLSTVMLRLPRFATAEELPSSPERWSQFHAALYNFCRESLRNYTGWRTNDFTAGG